MTARLWNKHCPAGRSRRVANLREDLRRWGLARSVYRRIMPRLSRFLNLSYATTRTLGRQEVTETHAGCSIRVATREELLRAAARPELQLSPEFINDALDRGGFCVGAFDRDELVAYVWRSFVATRHAEGIWVRFRAPYRYGYKALTLPAWRGRHLIEALGPVADRRCIERGRTHGINFVETHNFPSLAASRRLGDQRIGIIGYLHVGKALFPFRSSGPRKAGFGFASTPGDD